MSTPVDFQTKINDLDQKYRNLCFLAKDITDKYTSSMLDAVFVASTRAEDFTGGWVSAEEVEVAIQKAAADIERLTGEYIASVVSAMSQLTTIAQKAKQCPESDHVWTHAPDEPFEYCAICGATRGLD